MSFLLNDREIAGVVFDLDGTLYDKRPVERWVVTRMLPWLPQLVRYTRVRTGLAGVDCEDGEALARETLRRLSAAGRGQERWRRWIADRYEPTVQRAVERAGRARPGVEGLLLRLRAAGLRLGLVSDYRGAHDRLRALEIDPGLFQFSLVTEELGAMKPAARMARHTLAGMGLPGGRMVMVGDRAFADQRFAEACGMGFLGVGTGEAARDPRWMSWPALRARLSALTR